MNRDRVYLSSSPPKTVTFRRDKARRVADKGDSLKRQPGLAESREISVKVKWRNRSSLRWRLERFERDPRTESPSHYLLCVCVLLRHTWISVFGVVPVFFLPSVLIKVPFWPWAEKKRIRKTRKLCQTAGDNTKTCPHRYVCYFTRRG